MRRSIGRLSRGGVYWWIAGLSYCWKEDSSKLYCAAGCVVGVEFTIALGLEAADWKTSIYLFIYRLSMSGLASRLSNAAERNNEMVEL